MWCLVWFNTTLVTSENLVGSTSRDCVRVYEEGERQSARQLYDCHCKALVAARSIRCKSLRFPRYSWPWGRLVTTPVCLTGLRRVRFPSGSPVILAYSLLGEGTRLLTENEVGSNPTMPASFGNGSANFSR